jgi:hypothetical protein
MATTRSLSAWRLLLLGRVEYAKALMSGENLPGKMEGEEPDLSDELSEVWASAPSTT